MEMIYCLEFKIINYYNHLNPVVIKKTFMAKWLVVAVPKVSICFDY